LRPITGASPITKNPGGGAWFDAAYTAVPLAVPHDLSHTERPLLTTVEFVIE
jgi:hypothetical protein